MVDRTSKVLGLTVLCAVVFHFGWCPATATAQATMSLERGIRKQVALVLPQLQAEGIKSVGVLQFVVKKDENNGGINVGPLNQGLAKRVETSLILAMSGSDKPLINVVTNVSQVAGKIEGANLLTAEGRAQFFNARYPLAWATNAKIKVDAFITGDATFDDEDKTKLKIQMKYFTMMNGVVSELKNLSKWFAVALDPNILIGAGESFSLRAIFDNGDAEVVDATSSGPTPQALANAIADVKAAGTPDITVAQKLSIKLECFYNGQLQPIEEKGGRLVVPEPVKDQKVRYVLTRVGGGPGKVGGVLKINGENTIFHEKQVDTQCTRWVLSKDGEKVVIEGFLIREGAKFKSLPFTVLSQEESIQREAKYGINAGQISLAVFREGQKDPEPVLPPLKADREERRKDEIIQKDIVGAASAIAGNPEEDKLRGFANMLAGFEILDQGPNRGLIVPGDSPPKDTNAQEVTFKNPTLEGAIVIQYRLELPK